ncbi:MAG: hypothetical protein IT243_09055 [Bacteroidia bacterium]|nr:hypothetical protein [Bacteroidia bacterium]
MKRILFILSMSFYVSQAVYAQKISYTVDDYSSKLSPVKISIGVGVDANAYAGVLAEGAIGKKLGYNACYRREVYSFSNKELIDNKSEIKSGNYLEASVDFFLLDKMKKNKKLKITTSKNAYSEKYFIARVPMRKQKGLHGGISFSNRMFYTDADTSADKIIELSNANGKFVPNNGKIYGSNSTNMFAFGGLVFKKIKKTTVHANGWKYYSHLARRFYIDALFGFSSLSDVTISNAKYKAKPAKSSPVGYRVGVEWDQMGVVTSIEFGMRPGVQYLTPSFNYFNLNFSFNIYGTDKKYAMRNKK